MSKERSNRPSSDSKRVEISDNQIRHYNDDNKLNGMCTNNTSQNFGDVEFYDDGGLVFTVYNNGQGEGVTLRPENGASMAIGVKGNDIYQRGNQYFQHNVTGTVLHLTQEEALAKTDWLPNQLVEIIDEDLPLVTDDLDTNSTITDIALKVNQIIQVLRDLKLVRTV